MVPLTYPTIVVPGITASYLRDDYPLPPEHVWSAAGAVLGQRYERAAMHPDEPRFEAQQPALIRPGQIYELIYEQLIEELRHELANTGSAPVYPFAYDWRQPLEHTVEALNQFIEEVIKRTGLMKAYQGRKLADKVNVVGHSMGGLVIAGYASRHGQKKRINKAVTLGTPYQGSFETIIKITTGTADLGTKAPSAREREAARVTPALYYLTPSFEHGFEPPMDLFEVNNWQASIFGTVAAYIQEHSLKPKDDADGLSAQAVALVQGFLNQARDFRKLTNDPKLLKKAGLSKNDWLCIIGVDATTRVRLRIEETDQGNIFKLSSDDRQNYWDEPNAELKRLTGDGTVPLEGALPRFLPAEKLVCLTPDDFGYWEWQDKLVGAAGGKLHGALPAMNVVHRLIKRFFLNNEDRYGNTWGRPVPGVDANRWAPPFKGELRHKGG